MTVNYANKKEADMELSWDDSAEKNILEKSGYSTFEYFWFIEDNLKNEIDIKRRHIKNGKDILRQTVGLTINGSQYFLKRTSSDAFECIKTEYNAAEYVRALGITPPHIVMHAFDDENRKGMILYKARENFICLHDIQKGNLPEKNMDLQENVKKFYPELIRIFRSFQKSGYFYRDWMAKHIFINPETGEIGLIDLERFFPVNKAPLFWRLPLIYKYKRGKELKKFLSALKITRSEFNESKRPIDGTGKTESC